MEPKLKEVSDYLGKGKKFLLGNHITIADFPMYVSLDWHATLDEGCLAKFPALDNYLMNIRADPKIKAYMNTVTSILRLVAHLLLLEPSI